MKVASYNGCKVYNLSSGKTAPQWLSQSKRRALAKDEEYRRRLELIQDFEMPTASQCIAMTRDGEHIIVTGIYPPVVKCFTTNDLAMKFQRGLTCDVVAIESLSDDYSKLVFLQSDRTLSFHAAYGKHHSIRVPQFGRHMVYDWDSCDLLVAGNGNEVFRLNLEAGQFREPFELGFEGCNKLHINPVHQLLGAAGDGGVCEFWDPRQRRRVSALSVASISDGAVNVTELKFDSDGLTMGVGTANGFVHLYDIRSSTPMHSKEHQYGLPIVNITFHESSRTVLSADKKVVKIWSRQPQDMGKIMTNIETPANINSLVVAKDSRGSSGLIMMAGEQSRVMTYFVPQLGPAPRWCSFLEGLTEELEESAQNSVYEDFKFVTQQEIEDLGATGLVGTPMLKGYMHGFFMEMKLYNKLRAVSKPFEYEEYRKAKIKEKIDAKRENRISTAKKLPKVNKELAERMMKRSSTTENGEPADLVDSRFSALFKREEFQQDKSSAEYLLSHPNAQHKAANAAKRGVDSDDELDIYDAVEDDDEDDHDDEDQDSYHDAGSMDEDSEDEDEVHEKHLSKVKRGKAAARPEEEIGAIERASLKRRQQAQSGAGKKTKMFQLAEGFSVADAVFGDAKSLKENRRAAQALAAVPLKERLLVDNPKLLRQQTAGRGGGGRGGRGRGGRGGGRGGGGRGRGRGRRN